MKKVLWVDTETTGLGPKATVIQVSGLIEIDGKVEDEFNFKCRPFSKADVEEEALSIQSRTLEEIMAWQPPLKMHAELTAIFEKYINKFKRDDKFTPAGHNVKFDIDGLSNFFKLCQDNYFGSWMTWNPIDTMQLAGLLNYMDRITILNYKLEPLCNSFGIDSGAHDAMGDIKATRELGLKMIQMLNTPKEKEVL